MSSVVEIEHAISRLAPAEFAELANERPSSLLKARWRRRGPATALEEVDRLLDEAAKAVQHFTRT